MLVYEIHFTDGGSVGFESEGSFVWDEEKAFVVSGVVVETLVCCPEVKSNITTAIIKAKKTSTPIRISLLLPLFSDGCTDGGVGESGCEI